jgi:undecaprenyl-diphosphatase
VLFGSLTALVIAKATGVVDLGLIHSVRAEASPMLTAILLAVTFTSGVLAAPAAILFAIALYRRSGRRAMLFYAGTVLSGQAVNALLKFEVHRRRPSGISPRLTAAGGFAFPSADVMMAVLIFGIGALMLSWTFRSARARTSMVLASALFVAADAVARVYLGAHWPSDVLGGVLAGISWGALWIALAVVTREALPTLSES